MSKVRIAVAALSFSAAGLIGLAAKEHYTDRAVIPTKNDRPTLGFGSTYHEDGSPVKMGDTTTPVRALIKAHAHITKEEKKFHESLQGVELHQGEYDVFFDWTYQFGSSAWVGSDMLVKLKAGDYRGACQALKQYRFLTSSGSTPGWEPYVVNGKMRWKYDCSKPGNKVCRGVWTRQLERFDKCMEAQ